MLEDKLGRYGTSIVTALICCAASAPSVASAEMPASITNTKTITYCASISAPPLVYMKDGKPVGADIDLGDAIAAKLGLKSKWINMPFAGIIPAVLADHCDAIISQLYFKPERLQVLDMVPYMYSQETVIVMADQSPLDEPQQLSGMKVAAVTATNETSLLAQANDDLKKAGKKPINVVTFPDSPAALQQLQFGQVQAYAIPYEVGSFYLATQPGKFKLGAKPYFRVLTDIGINKTHPELRDAISGALTSLEKDGTYTKIFAKWDLSADTLPLGN